MIAPTLLPQVLAHGALVLVAGWMATDHTAWLVAAAVCMVFSAALLRGRAAGLRWGLVVIVVALLVGFAADGHVRWISSEWPERAERWETQIRSELAQELDRLLAAGEEAAALLVSEVDDVGSDRSPSLPMGFRPAEVDALAVFGPGGELISWDGSHQGPVPRSVRLGLRPYTYEEGALFGYLYVVRPLREGRGTAMAAILLRADLPPSLEDASGDFVSRFERRTGADLQVAREDRAEGQSVWDLRWDGDVLFSVGLSPASEAEARDRVRRRWAMVALAMLLAGWLLIGLSVRGTRRGKLATAGALVAVVVLLPIGELASVPRLFSPADFLLPGPAGVTLGEFVLLASVAVFLLGFLRPSHLPRVPDWAVAAIGVVGGLGLLALIGAGASRDLLAGPEPLWIVYVASGVLALSAWLYPLALAGRSRERDHPAWKAYVAGVAVALALGGVAAVWMRATANLPAWFGAAWLVPFGMIVYATGSDERWRTGVLRWVGVGIVAATLVLPRGWADRIEARIAVAEERVEKLGTTPDPFLEFLLFRAGEEARELSGTGREPVEVLYSAWTGSGLAMEGVPVWLTWWSVDGVATEELRIGVPGLRPRIPVELLLDALDRDEVVIERFDQADAHYIAAAPVGEGGVVTAVVPPRRRVLSESPLGPLFTPAHTDPDPLALIPVLSGERSIEPGEIRWISTADGLQGETQVIYPDEIYHGHYLIELPGGLLLAARGTLLSLAGLMLLLALWSAGRRMASGPEDGPHRVRAALTSFRGRVTLALFGFFFLPAVLFGTLAYRTLAGASVRTAEALAARAVDDAASWFYDTGGALDLLASRVGSDLLLYDGGQLVGGSMRELIELGLYEGWLPPQVQEKVGRGEELTATTAATLGGWEYVVAFQRIPGGLVLAAPAPLQAGATAVRQREVADLLGFALILGAGLSVLLALGVGRALTRPIQTLQVASERVGSGNMGVHLPTDRTDEFGAVFSAFNRMVDRLAQTRRALLASSRRTRAIVEEVATGVVALDAEGRVTLANPRAEALLGTSIPRDRPLPTSTKGGEPLEALGPWVHRFLRDGPEEAGTELPMGDRRIRIRARRITGSESSGGAVLAFEDVTDELRTERILAWGEMAQQVAHEVKNPLTPIKLGVQHIRRAWRDGSAEYDRILDRNVDAILLEIERLAAVASSFSRYGAPSPAGTSPMERVEIASVVGEVMDLYAVGEGAVNFHADLPAEMPPVRARPGELKEVLVNLLENARAVLADGGTVSIGVDVAGDVVRLRVSDDGPGIPEDILSRVFEPHFSTHSSGSGLGLAIVRRLVESWGGRVRVASTSSAGTTMEVEMMRWSSSEGVPPKGSLEGPAGTDAEGLRTEGGGDRDTN